MTIGFGLCAVALLCLAVLCFLFLKSGSPRQWLIDDTQFTLEINKAALNHNLPPELIKAVIYVESGFNPQTIGKKGEVGLMQILPTGAIEDWCRKKRCARPTPQMLMNPELNLEIGCWYLAKAYQNWKKYKAATEMSLAQYNAGKQRVMRWKTSNFQAQPNEFIKRITISSTRLYVSKIMKLYKSYLAQKTQTKMI